MCIRDSLSIYHDVRIVNMQCIENPGAVRDNKKRAVLVLLVLHVDYTHIMVDGKIVATGDGSLVDKINQEGYESFIREAGVADARN